MNFTTLQTTWTVRLTCYCKSMKPSSCLPGATISRKSSRNCMKSRKRQMKRKKYSIPMKDSSPWKNKSQFSGMSHSGFIRKFNRERPKCKFGKESSSKKSQEERKKFRQLPSFLLLNRCCNLLCSFYCRNNFLLCRTTDNLWH